MLANFWTVQAYKFDGIVLEVWSQLGGQAKKALHMLIKQIGDALKKANLTFILVLPPPVTSGGKPGMVDHDDMKYIFQYVDYFSLMTYDYSSPERPGTMDNGADIFRRIIFHLSAKYFTS